MRICLLSREYPPETGWGGIATYTYHQAHGLKELGHDVEVIALAKAGDNGAEGLTSVQDGITVNRVECDVLSDLTMVKASTPFTHYVLSAAIALSKKFSEIHQKNPFDVAECPEHLAEGLCPALTKCVPLLLRLHTPQSKLIAEAFHNITPSFDQQFVAMLERVAMLNADVITSPSLDMAQYVSKDLAIPLEQIQIIHNQIDEKHFCPQGDKALPPEDRLTVLTIGRLEPRKGVHHLIEAVPLIVKDFPKVRFVIIGADTKNAQGQTSTLADLTARLEKLECRQSVTFLSHVDMSLLPAYYRSADVFVLPSLYDNAPMTILEAMASGNAIVATSAGGAKEYALNEECGLIVPAADPPAMAEAIVRLLKNGDERKVFGQNARLRIESQLTRKFIAGQTIPAYEQAIAAYKTKTALYRHGDERFMVDAESLLKSYQKMLYDLLYQKSPLFRFKHRVKKLLSKPDAS